MFPHPEDLHRAHQFQHANLIRTRERERRARAAGRAAHSLREIVLQLSTFLRSRRWWKSITALFARTTSTVRSAGAATSITDQHPTP